MLFETKKPLLFITPSVPTVKAAGDKFTMHLIEDLAKYQKVHLIYFYKSGSQSYSPPSNVKVILSIEVKTIDRYFSVLGSIKDYPIFSVRYSRKNIKRIKEAIQGVEYAAVFLNYSQVFKYGTLFRDTPIFSLSHDVIYQRALRQKSSLMAKWAYITERRILKSFNSTVFTFSDKDCSLLKKWYDIDSHPVNFYLDENILKATATDDKFDYLVLFGAWSRKENTYGLEWFFERVYPKLSERPKVKIIGGKLSQEIVKKLTKYKQVEYLGFVDNPYPLIANAKAVLAPLFHGAGVKVKVIESFACGTPVIGTDVAFEGISLKYDEFMFHANDAYTYLNIIESLSITISKRSEMKKYFITQYTSESIPKYINNIIE